MNLINKYSKQILIIMLLFTVLIFIKTNINEFPRRLTDRISDINVIDSSILFEEYGFFNLKGRLYHPPIINREHLYTGYPPLPNWSYYFIIKLFRLNIQDIHVMKIFIITFTIFGVILTYILFNKILGHFYSLIVTLITISQTTLYILGPTFHQSPYTYLFLPLTLLAIILYYENQNIKNTLFFLISNFLLSLSSYEYYIYTTVFLVFYHIYQRQKLNEEKLNFYSINKNFKKTFIILIIGFILAIGLWYSINLSYLGLKEFLIDLSHRFLKHRKGSISSFSEFLRYIWFIEKDLGPGFFLCFLSFFTIIFEKVFKREKLYSKEILIIGFWLSNASWEFFLPKHMIYHYYYSPRHFTYAVGMTIAYFIEILYQKIKNKQFDNKTYILIILNFIFVYTTFDKITELFFINNKPIITDEVKKSIENILKEYKQKNINTIYLVDRIYTSEGYFFSGYINLLARQYDIKTIRNDYLKSQLSEFKDINDFNDYLDKNCPGIIMFYSKSPYSLTYETWDENKGFGIGYLMRKYINNRKVDKSPEIKEFDIYIYKNFKNCIIYEDDRYVIYSLCKCK